MNYLASNVVSGLDVAVPLYHHDLAECSMKSVRFSLSFSQKSTMVCNWHILVPEHPPQWKLYVVSNVGRVEFSVCSEHICMTVFRLPDVTTLDVTVAFPIVVVV